MFSSPTENKNVPQAQGDVIIRMVAVVTGKKKHAGGWESYMSRAIMGILTARLYLPYNCTNYSIKYWFDFCIIALYCRHCTAHLTRVTVWGFLCPAWIDNNRLSTGRFPTSPKPVERPSASESKSEGSQSWCLRFRRNIETSHCAIHTCTHCCVFWAIWGQARLQCK